MVRRTPILAVALLSAMPAVADPVIGVVDPYLRVSSPDAPTGAAFMAIENTGDLPDRLVGVRSDIAARVELHTHFHTDNGVARMQPLESGIEIPPGGRHSLARGGDHVMFMGLQERLDDGATVSVTLVFETSGEIVVEIPVDSQR